MAKIYLDPELKDFTIEKIEELNKNKATSKKWAGNSKPNEPMTPREYQYEILKKAESENIIAVLDTGAGKTLISVMLVKHMQLIEDEKCRTVPGYKRKITFFLVERVPLVFQQFNVLESNCDARIQKFCGEMNVDTWSKSKWLEIFDNVDVCIMTAQIFPDILQRGFLSLDRANLLIFDECHHTTKGHPYNLTMHVFYHPMKGPRPKIFGMTASPAGRADVEKSIDELEKNLDAKVYTAIQTQELADAINKPSEEIVRYSMRVIDDLPNQRSGYVELRYNPTILTTLITKKIQTVPGFDKCISIINFISNTLGPWCSNALWKETLKNAHTNGLDASDNNTNMVYRRKYKPNDIQSIKEAYNLCTPPTPNPDTNNLLLFTPKLQALIHSLTTIHKQNEFHGIIFVERRHTAKAIKILIESMDRFKETIRCDILVGHGGLNNTPGSVQMKLNDQHDIIQKFRSGQLNLIIATSVAEEGLDIQACNYVIRFDLFKTPAAYIQSRGRARQREAKYILMINEQNPKEYKLLSKFQQIEKQTKAFCRALPSERNVAQLFGDDYDPESIKKATFDRFNRNAYEIKSTGAKLTLYGSIALVHQYCDALPADEFCNFKPVYKMSSYGSTSFLCILTLPTNSEQKQFQAVGESKHEAKMIVSLEACISLHKSGAINDNLIPANKKVKERLEELDEAGKQIGSRGRETFYPKSVPSFWNPVPDKTLGIPLGPYWISYIETNNTNYRKICLITKYPLPPIPNIETNQACIKLNRIKTKFMFQKPEQVQMLVDYMIAITRAVTHKEFTCAAKDTPYFLAPLQSTGSFDWKEIKSTIRYENTTITDIDQLQDTILLNQQNGKFHFFEKVQHDMTPNSMMKENISFANYYKTKVGIEIKNLQQPLLLATRVNQNSSSDTSSENSHFLVPELCLIYSICASVFRTLQLLPTLQARIDATLLVLDAQKSLNLTEIDTTLMVEAYTASSTGISINYQRLEFLGDSVLKLVASTFVFVKNVHSNEDALTVARTTMISNKTLFQSAHQLGLYRYICSQTLPRRFWRPPHFITTSDSDQMTKVLQFHKLADKTLADVIESTLGAAYMTDPTLKLPLEAAQKLKVPLESIQVWTDFNRLFETHRSHSFYDPSLREANVDRVMEIVGHRFKNQGLVVEALTHASVPSSSVPCYQRLEFLGDAVLDFCVTNYLFKKYDTAPPGLLHNLRKSSVNNDILSILCVQLGLHRHIRHGSSFLMESMLHFIQLAEANKEAEGEYWLEFNPPKVLSDIIESLMGAVYVDCEFQLEPVLQLFERWLKPILENHISLESIQEHPLGKLKCIVQAYGCFQCETKNITQNASGTQKCIVFLHQKPFTSGSGFNTKEARKEAATRACELLQDPQLLPLLCTCKSSSKDF